MIADAVPTRRGGARHSRRGSIGQRSPNGNATAVPAVLRASPIAGWGTNDQATTSRSGRYRVDVGCRLRADLSAGATASARHTGNLRTSATADPGSSTTTTTVAPSPDGDHRELEIHKEVDKKGNTVIEKDTHGEGIAGSTETHTKTETDRDGGTTTTRETTTKPG